MTNSDSQRIREIRDNTKAMAEAFSSIANTLADALELFIATKTETQNSNLTFEKRTMRDCYNCKRFETDDECIECHYEPKDEPQTENPCDGCVCDDGKHLMYCMNCKGIAWKTEPPKIEDEPQTERSE